MNKLLALAMILFLSSKAMGAVKTQTVEYKDGETVLEGYLAYDDSLPGGRPGVLVVHEWTGLGTYVKMRCEKLARLGYVAFGADIYGKGVRPATPDAAGAEAGKFEGDRPLLRRRANAALNILRQNPLVDTTRVAAIGYCFGGGTALELARSGAPLAGVVSFHGFLDTPTPDDAKNIKGKVLVLRGADDPYVPAKDIAALEDEMRKAGVDWQEMAFGGAVHSFTNPEAGNDNSKGAAYNESADRRSWEAMKTFFAEIFK
ncbi:MAG: dienelactone hydrolase family protein [candidate division Zixibacteria bacterium]|nr:dienelactone hydrolase family protein [candidate division Zixibacteria bacterium]